MVANRNKFANNIQNKYRYKKADTINVNLDNRAKGLFDSLGLSYQKIPTLNHNEKLPDQIEGVYKKDNLSLRKNPRVSDKKAEAVAMHEIYHYIQKDKGMNLADEEQGANLIEQAYLNENQQASQEPDFDLIYAHTIRQFYEHDELEQLVRVFGGDTSSARRLYSNAMSVISEAQKEEDIQLKPNQLNNSGIKHMQKDEKFKVSADYSTIKDDLSYDWFDWVVTDSNVKNVKNILDNLEKEDWTDTKNKMVKDKIWSRFLNNLSSYDKLNLKKWKEVSGTAMTRLTQAEEAIEHTKDVFKYGAGNQLSAIRESLKNSNFRTIAMRKPKYWNLTKLVQPIAKSNPLALVAAKADIVHGGNCDEHASVAFDYLRYKYSGVQINKVSVKDEDHAFVLIGSSSNKDEDIVVADAWPTEGKATIWKDHFIYTKDRSKISIKQTMIADGKNIKKVISDGLSLTPEGILLSKKKLSPEGVEDTIEESEERDEPWIWDESDSSASGKKYNYFKKKSLKKPSEK